MNTQVNFDLSLHEPVPCFNPIPVPTQEEIRMNKIRQMSNIIQALENVLIQTDEVDGFETMRESVQDYLNISKDQMAYLIHQSR